MRTLLGTYVFLADSCGNFPARVTSFTVPQRKFMSCISGKSSLGYNKLSVFIGNEVFPH